jgi:hypothetical protein
MTRIRKRVDEEKGDSDKAVNSSRSRAIGFCSVEGQSPSWVRGLERGIIDLWPTVVWWEGIEDEVHNGQA